MAARHGRIARLPVSRSDSATSQGPAEGPPAVLIPGREHAFREELLGLAIGLPGTSSRQEEWRRAEAMSFALDWLEGFPGDSWQDRWLLSGADGQGREWGPGGLTPRWRNRLTSGTGMLIVLRAVRPGYAWLSASRLLGVYDGYRRHNQAGAFAELGRLAGRDCFTEHEAEALNALTRMVIVTGKDLRSLVPGDFAEYVAARRACGAKAASLPLAYELLHAIGGLAGAPPTWQQASSRGQLTVAELVDRYPIACRPVRDVLVHYLTERSAALDYGSLVNQAQMLASLFWADIERHHPGIDTLRLPPEVAHGWKQRIRVLPDGTPRRNSHAMLLAQRRVYASQCQEAFMQGHAEAFAVLGGIPFRHVRYDNLKPAVNQVCFGRTRVESQRWTAFRSHYQFDAFYCMPGKDGAHEKGGVEHEGGRFRRTHLVPVPEVETLAELNERLAAIDAAEDARHVHGAAESIGERFDVERGLLAPLPADGFDYGLTLTPTVRRDSRIVVRQCYYSVPARFIGRQVRVSLRANELLIYDGGQVIAGYPRLTRRWDYRDTLDHYLEILMSRPGALAGSAGLAQARADGSFTPAHDAFWAAARAAHGDAAGTRALIEVLLLHRRMPAADVLAGITAALDAGSASHELVAIEARKAAQAARDLPAAGEKPGGQAPGGDAGDGQATVITLTGRREPLPADTRPLPSVDAYDQLLTLPARKGAS